MKPPAPRWRFFVRVAIFLGIGAAAAGQLLAYIVCVAVLGAAALIFYLDDQRANKERT